MPLFNRNPPEPLPEVETATVSEDIPVGNEMLRVTSAVGPLRLNAKGGRSGIGRRKRDRKTEYGEGWQQAIIEFDRDGPGFVGYGLDLLADLGALVRIRVEYFDRETNDWVEATSAASGELLRTLRGPFQTTEELFKSLIRGIGQIGEMAFLPIDWDGHVRYLAVMPTTIEGKGRDQVNRNLPALYVVKLRPDAKPEDADAGLYFELPRNRYFRIWEPDPEYPALAHSDWRRTIDDIRRYRTIQRAIFRAASSQLVNAGLLRFEGSASDVGDLRANKRRGGDTPGNRVSLGYLGTVIDSLTKAGKEHLGDIHEEMVSAAMPHPIVTPNSVEYIDLGRAVDGTLLAAKQDALEDVARASPVPRSVIVEGLGSSERQLNNYLQDETLKQTGVIPLVTRGCQGLTLAFLHPQMRSARSKYTPATLAPNVEGLTIDDFRIGYDDSPLQIEEDQTDAVAEGIKIGSLAPRAYARAINMEEFALEPGTPDWDHWLAVHGKTDEPEQPPAQPALPAPPAAVAASANWYDDLIDG